MTPPRNKSEKRGERNQEELVIGSILLEQENAGDNVEESAPGKTRTRHDRVDQKNSLYGADRNKGPCRQFQRVELFFHVD